MLVGKSDFDETLSTLARGGYFSLDTETTGLNGYLQDHLFALIIASGSDTLYFNFQPYSDLDPEYVLPRTHLSKFTQVLDNPSSTWFIQNAKFDLSMLAREGLRVAGTIHDTEVMARLLESNHLSYNLENLLKRMNKARGTPGPEKLDTVKEYIKEHKLFTEVEVPGKKGLQKHWHMERVPLEIVQPYAESDARGTYELGMYQRDHLAQPENAGIAHVAEREKRLTHVCFDLERHGIRLNRGYCEDALAFEMARKNAAQTRFKAIAGVPYVDSGKALEKVFLPLGIVLPRTPKGNPACDEETLSGIDHELCKIILEERDADKKAGTYYSSFLHYADRFDCIHANLRQSGTTTGRFSCSDPNLQNIPKEEDLASPWVVRRAFIPRQGHALVMIDYDQMEYRLMLDAAQETELIEAILGGLDVHEATGKLMGVPRQTAKTINFMLLYGGGAAKLAKALKISVPQANDLKALYFSTLPRVKKMIYALMKRGEIHGYIKNWAGRRCHVDRGYAYKAPNYFIQGGCADIMKEAMVRVADVLRLKKSKIKMVVQVHDEVVFDVPYAELDFMPTVKEIMEKAYPHKHLPMTCSLEWSPKSWADKEDWDDGSDARDALQAAAPSEVTADSPEFLDQDPDGGPAWDS